MSVLQRRAAGRPPHHVLPPLWTESDRRELHGMRNGARARVEVLHDVRSASADRMKPAAVAR
jgi:hypothetical protein